MLQCSKIDPPSSFSQPPAAAAAAGKSSETSAYEKLQVVIDVEIQLIVSKFFVWCWWLRGTEVLCVPEMSSLWMWQRCRLSRLCFPSFIISLIFLSCVIWQGYYKHKYIRKYSLSLCPLVSFLNIFLINNRWRSLALKVLLAVTSQQRIIWYSSLSSASFMSPLCLWLSVSQPNFQHAAVLSKNKKLHCRHQVH